MTTDPAPAPSTEPPPPTIPPPARVPQWPESQPDWVGELVSQFAAAAGKALELRLEPVYRILEELKTARTEQDEEIRALKAQVRKLRRRLDKAGIP